jgi:hypothetical protein
MAEAVFLETLAARRVQCLIGGVCEWRFNESDPENMNRPSWDLCDTSKPEGAQLAAWLQASNEEGFWTWSAEDEYLLKASPENGGGTLLQCVEEVEAALRAKVAIQLIQRPEIKQLLLDTGINAFGLDLVCESFLRSLTALRVTEQLGGALYFEYPIHRTDCPGHVGVRVRLEPMPDESEAP